MTDARLVGTNPEDSTLVPVAVNAQGQLKVEKTVIEEIPNDLQVDGSLTVTGDLIGADGQPIQGIEGPKGDKGDPGEPGPPGSVDLPEGEFEGAVLGWKQDALAWISPSELILPDGVFGPVADWDRETGRLTVVGTIPDEVMTGVTLYQCTAGGTVATEGWRHDMVWSANMGNTNGSYPAANAFDGNEGTGARVSYSGWATWKPPNPIGFNQMRINSWYQSGDATDYGRYKLFGQSYVNFTPHRPGDWGTVVDTPGLVEEVAIRQEMEPSVRMMVLGGIELDGLVLVDPVHSPKFDVSSVDGQVITGTTSSTKDFTPGFYLKVPQTGRRIPRLRGAVTTTDIDLARRK